MTERFQATVAVHLFLLRGNEVLLLRRHNTGYEDGNFSVVAGHLDGDETATTAMAREAAEEAGIMLAPSDLHFVHVMHRKETGETDERIDFFFAATSWHGDPSINEPDKCSELHWAALDDLPQNVVPYVRAALEHYRQHRSYSEFWPEPTAVAERAEPEPVLRPGVRVIVVDADERVLLFAGVGEEDRFWFPPGGGSEPGETAEETARRELYEETGLTNMTLDGEIGTRRHVVAWNGVTYDLRERWFLARVAPFEIDTSGFSEDERLMIADHRWWPLDELETTSDRLVPANLAALVRSLLRDGPPRSPIELQR